MAAKKRELSMTEGSMLKNIILFSLPLILTGLLQTFYNAADLIVVGRFEGHIALAAVGSTGALSNLIVGVFMGLSVGAGVCVAQYIGAREYDRVRKVIHTSVMTALILGTVVGVLAVIFTRDLLLLMDTPSDIIDHSTLYMRIIFCGVPANMLYNYCAAILRSSGDTKHPLVFLSLAGLVNVVLNIILVTLFHLGVAGVAIATVTSQVLSALMIVVYMSRSQGYLKISFRDLKISKEELFRILKIGIPSGVQGALFSLSNVAIQSAINSFDSIVIAGNSAANNIETFIWVAMNSLHQAAITFVGQNVGAKKYKRVGKALTGCLVVVTFTWALVTGVAMLFRQQLLGLYANGDAAIIEAGISRMSVIAATYLLCGYMEVICGAVRAMGKSFTTMVFTIVGVVGVRILWINTVFKALHTPLSVYLSYPVSWTISIAFNLAIFVVVYKKTLKLGYIPERRMHLLSKK